MAMPTSKICALLRVLIAIPLSAPALFEAQGSATARPNIIVIMTDDQRFDDMRVMPKTRALLGDAGTTFSNCHVTIPTCCPSRATYLTGQYPHNHGVWTNDPPTGGYAKFNDSNSLALWLQEAGYFTSHIGKYLNGYPPDTNRTLIPPGWDNWQSLMSGAPMYNYAINYNGTIVQYGSAPADYGTDVIASRAVHTIGELAAQPKPFFLSITPKAIHDDLSLETLPNPIPAPRHMHTFDSAPLPLPPSFDEADVTDKPSEIQNLTRIPPASLNEVIQKYGLFSYQVLKWIDDLLERGMSELGILQSELAPMTEITGRYRSRLETLQAVDELVERIINELSELGILDNTVVFFTSDNGWFQGEHRIRRGKGRIYDEATHVPLIIRGGGFPADVTAEQFVSNIDLSPTIVQLAGTTAWLPMDGRSLLPLATDPTVGTHRDILIEMVGVKGIRNKSFLYAEYHYGSRELYDMRKGTKNYDPYQLHSRHADKAYNQIQTQLRSKLDQLRTCSGASCRLQ